MRYVPFYQVGAAWRIRMLDVLHFVEAWATEDRMPEQSFRKPSAGFRAINQRGSGGRRTGTIEIVCFRLDCS